jgi:hypothetical protein
VDANFSSLWLKDVCQLGVIKVEEGGDWCRDIMVKKVGNGEVTRFWHDIWISSCSLCQAFPSLYSVSLQKEDHI